CYRRYVVQRSDSVELLRAVDLGPDVRVPGGKEGICHVSLYCERILQNIVEHFRAFDEFLSKRIARAEAGRERGHIGQPSDIRPQRKKTTDHGIGRFDTV